jgi:hypothetical protein
VFIFCFYIPIPIEFTPYYKCKECKIRFTRQKALINRLTPGVSNLLGWYRPENQDILNDFSLSELISVSEDSRLPPSAVLYVKTLVKSFEEKNKIKREKENKAIRIACPECGALIWSNDRRCNYCEAILQDDN